MFGDTMKLAVAVCVFGGLIAFSWQKVYSMMGDVAIRDMGIPPHIHDAFVDYKPSAVIPEMKEMIDFFEKAHENGTPRAILDRQYEGFCVAEARENPARDAGKCRKLFRMVLDHAYQKK